MAAAVFAMVLPASPAFAFVITPYFDASVTSSMQGAINLAIGNIEALYSNPGSVGIVFQEQSGTFLGESEASDYTSTYSAYTGLLTAASVAHPTNSILATAVANLSKGNDANGARSIALTSADARIALGQVGATGCFSTSGNFVGSCGQAADGIVIISSSYLFNYSNTAVPGQYTAVTTVEHEINEILGGGGQGSTLNAVATNATPFSNETGVLDLYRYSAPNTPVFSATTLAGCPAYFSVDGGVTNIINFNQSSTGDLADFCGNNNIQSAFSNTGVSPSYTTSSPEFAMLQSIGYDGVVAEPATLALLATGLAGLQAVRRRRNGRSAN